MTATRGGPALLCGLAREMHGHDERVAGGDEGGVGAVLPEVPRRVVENVLYVWRRPGAAFAFDVESPGEEEGWRVESVAGFVVHPV